MEKLLTLELVWEGGHLCVMAGAQVCEWPIASECQSSYYSYLF